MFLADTSGCLVIFIETKPTVEEKDLVRATALVWQGKEETTTVRPAPREARDAG